MNLQEYLQELSFKPSKFRKKVEVYIIFKDKLIVGLNERWGKKRILPAAGGIENKTPEKAAEIECLEELGVLIDKPKYITKKSFKIDWTNLKGTVPAKMAERMREYRGVEIYFMYGYFKKIDRRFYGRDEDAMVPKIMTVDQLRKEYMKTAKGTLTFRKLNQHRLYILDELQKQIPELK
jgi:8-oxo-dGTP pyrophosphatase MutT (NUDIX family)